MNNRILYTPNEFSLKNKIILIIKLYENIENKIIKSFINCGAKLIILEKSTNILSTLYSKMTIKQKQNIFFYPNCSTNKDYYKFSQNIYKTFGRVDGIIYNIPILGNSTPIEQYEIQELYKVMNFNFYNIFMTTKTIVPLIKLSKNPSIIFTTYNISNLDTYWSGYACANAALQTLIKIIHSEYKNISNIKINQIQLKMHNTNLYKKEFPGLNKNFSTNIKNLINIYTYLISNKNKNNKYKTFIINKNINIYKT
ncbi:MAG: SDR family NAD(P)-dependent oxidoreductase [Candidatus Azosocius agrarius]|nr:MAG: SDR family NAD(P)-dependent oxidoreductase [Gammaproteobacteria bacterium]